MSRVSHTVFAVLLATSLVACSSKTAAPAPITAVPTSTHTTATPTLIPTWTSTPVPTDTPTATPTPTPVPSLSGRITDAATGQGISGARVEAKLAGHGWDYSAATASDGSYAMFGLPTSDYEVRVTAAGYAREYYDNVNPSDDATLVHVAGDKWVHGIDFDLNEGGSISGHVYQSDGVTPISGARVFVRPSKHGLDDGFHVTTNSTGYYWVDGLSLGHYRVTVEASGYAMLRYYDGAYGWNNATDVRVNPPDATPDINVSLDLAGSISGFVFGSDGVTPIPGVGLIADTTTGNFEGIGGHSNDGGHYIIEGLPPGKYTVRTDNMPKWYAGEFYDSKYTWQSTDAVAVTAGDDISSINFTLDEGGLITGHVFDEETGEPIGGIQLGASTPGGDAVTPAPVTSVDGSYRFVLRPGSYLIRAGISFAHAHGYGYVPEWYDNSYDMNSATLVNVTLHNETAGIDIYLAGAGSISGHVYQGDGTTPIAGASVYAFPTTGDHPGAGANTGPDGSYTIEGLPSGSYRVQAAVSDYVAQYYDNTPDEASATEVTVNARNDTPGVDFALSPVSD
jgi:hypothetical protein